MSSLQTTIDHLKGDNEALAAQVDAAEQGLLDSIADAAGSEATASQALITSEGALAEAQEDRSRAGGAEAVAVATRVLTEEAQADAQAGVTTAGAVADAAEAVVVPAATPADLGKLKAIASVYGQPSLELDFVNQRYTVQGDAPWLREDLDPATDLTFTRATPKWVFDATGTLVEVPADTMAIDHDPVTGESLGVLIEPSSTNTLIHSGDLAQAAWEKFRVSVSQESDSRFGTVNRVTATEAGTHYLNQSTPSTGVQSRYAVVKKVNHRYIGLSFVTIDGGGGQTHAVFDFDTGTFTQSISGSGRGTFPVENLGDGWFRLGIYRDGTYGLRLWFPKEPTGDRQSASADFVADGEEFLVAHTQTETGTYPTSYIPTAGAPVTRAADSFQMPTGDALNRDGSCTHIHVSWGDTAWGEMGRQGVIQIGDLYYQKSGSGNQSNWGGISLANGAYPPLDATDLKLAFNLRDFTRTIEHGINGVFGTRTYALYDFRDGVIRVGRETNSPAWVKQIAITPRYLTKAELIEVTS